LLLAIVTGLAKNFLVSNRPGDAGDWYRKDKEPDKLETDGHSSSWMQRRRQSSSKKGELQILYLAIRKRADDENSVANIFGGGNGAEQHG
jgi:hypothetical protein